MLKKLFIFFFILKSTSFVLQAQVYQNHLKVAEIGFSAGVGHYFGDLNPEAQITVPKIAASIFYTKQFNNYLGLKISGTYAQLGYADKYSSNFVQQRRNLSFNTDVWELALMGDFNFFSFYPGNPEYTYTPYIGLGLGVFSFNPYAYYRGQKYYLRELGTEGQLSSNGAQVYSNVALAIPVCFGFKFNVSRQMNVYTELCYRFTTTDYLDDVSGNYNPNAFNTSSNSQQIAYMLQDRSYETGSRIGIQGRQRGNSSQNDSYITFQVGISFNLLNYKCPAFETD